MLGSVIKKLFSPNSSKDIFRPTRSLAECFELANSEIYTRSHGFLSNRAYRFFAESNRIDRVTAYINERFGLITFQYIGCGDNAIVVRYSDCQALRFRGPVVEAEVNTQTVVKSPFICPIWEEIEFDRARLDFVPYVRSLAINVSAELISRAVAEEYVFALLRAGFESSPPLWFYDYKNYDHKFEQIGLLSDGTPIIIDQGSVIPAADAPKERLAKLAEDMSLVSMRPVSATASWDGSWFDCQGRQKIDSLAKPGKTLFEHLKT